MFYAIEYAYGRNIVNNGNRGDRVLVFTAKRLRDAWVSAGTSWHGAGNRDNLSARHPFVRGVDGLEDGDNEGWRVLAEQRVNNSRVLSKYTYELINYDWGNTDHYRWTATAPEREIISWAKSIENVYA